MREAIDRIFKNKKTQLHNLKPISNILLIRSSTFHSAAFFGGLHNRGQNTLALSKRHRESQELVFSAYLRCQGFDSHVLLRWYLITRTTEVRNSLSEKLSEASSRLIEAIFYNVFATKTFAHLHTETSHIKQRLAFVSHRLSRRCFNEIVFRCFQQ